MTQAVGFALTIVQSGPQSEGLGKEERSEIFSVEALWEGERQEEQTLQMSYCLQPFSFQFCVSLLYCVIAYG